jgi:hypothetical protein
VTSDSMWSNSKAGPETIRALAALSMAMVTGGGGVAGALVEVMAEDKILVFAGIGARAAGGTVMVLAEGLGRLLTRRMPPSFICE